MPSPAARKVLALVRRTVFRRWRRQSTRRKWCVTSGFSAIATVSPMFAPISGPRTPRTTLPNTTQWRPLVGVRRQYAIFGLIWKGWKLQIFCSQGSAVINYPCGAGIKWTSQPECSVRRFYRQHGDLPPPLFRKQCVGSGASGVRGAGGGRARVGGAAATPHVADREDQVRGCERCYCHFGCQASGAGRG